MPYHGEYRCKNDFNHEINKHLKKCQICNKYCLQRYCFEHKEWYSTTQFSNEHKQCSFIEIQPRKKKKLNDLKERQKRARKKEIKEKIESILREYAVDSNDTIRKISVQFNDNSQYIFVKDKNQFDLSPVECLLLRKELNLSERKYAILRNRLKHAIRLPNNDEIRKTSENIQIENIQLLNDFDKISESESSDISSDDDKMSDDEEFVTQEINLRRSTRIRKSKTDAEFYYAEDKSYWGQGESDSESSDELETKLDDVRRENEAQKQLETVTYE